MVVTNPVEDTTTTTATTTTTTTTASAISSNNAPPSNIAHPSIPRLPHKCTINDAAINKFLKTCLPHTTTPEIFVMPNTVEALANVAEKFTMLISFVATDICAGNDRKSLTEHDIYLALKEIGMEQLIEPLKQSLLSARPPKKRATTIRKKKVGGNKRGIQMMDLILKGLIKPGKEVLKETYKEQTFKADLQDDGTIVHNGKEFYSPSSFSIYVRKLVGTHQDSSNGWQAVRYVDGETVTKLIVFKNLALADNQVSISLNLTGNEDEKKETTTDQVENNMDVVAAVDVSSSSSSSSNKRPAESIDDKDVVADAPPMKRAKVEE